ncbi:hypothetical protein JDV02_002057 [Purpureocillium takamizusanense]|uniref:Apple domain-containing protein n=1 Tax=Purpureocillium takamizusanense TaxID=2060973 RepID=A0A9Q8V8F8_9HYPO|nr:uncharacterized protein JDV02_002057 [Purpureocillium takamizusanense]UNI15531.1 hypothetical protein JDV02_002057 [Purpureocillium takamizusanense]
MRRSTVTAASVLLAHGGLGLAAALSACNADNCYRQVSATRFGQPVLTSRIRDCESFLRTTVVPAAVTDWVTQTVTPATVTDVVATVTDSVTTTVSTVVQTSTVTVTAAEKNSNKNNNSPARGRRDNNNSDPGKGAGETTIVPTNVPAYASSCADAAAYSSACLCASATRTTVTAPAPTVTSTRTVSATATVHITAHATITVSATATRTETVTATVGRPCAGGLVLDPNPPAGADCARRGWRDPVKAPVVGRGDGASVEACANSCRAKPACKAFIYGDPARGWNNVCELEGGANGRADNEDTPFWWYDMACFKCA